LYLLFKPATETESALYKIGISNVPAQRHTHLSKSGWQVLEMTGPMNGTRTRLLEQSVLDYLDDNDYPRGKAAFTTPFEGYTEAWRAEDFAVASLTDLILLIAGPADALGSI
jgi:hypothetical protein